MLKFRKKIGSRANRRTLAADFAQSAAGPLPRVCPAMELLAKHKRCQSDIRCSAARRQQSLPSGDQAASLPLAAPFPQHDRHPRALRRTAKSLVIRDSRSRSPAFDARAPRTSAVAMRSDCLLINRARISVNLLPIAKSEPDQQGSQPECFLPRNQRDYACPPTAAASTRGWITLKQESSRLYTARSLSDETENWGRRRRELARLLFLPRFGTSRDGH